MIQAMASAAQLTLGIRFVPVAPVKTAFVLVQGFEGQWSGFQLQRTFGYPDELAGFLEKAFAPYEVDAFIEQLPQKEGVLLMLNDAQATLFGFSTKR